MLTSASLRVRACAWLRPPPAKGWCLWHSSRGKSRRHAGNSRGRQGGGLTAVTGEIPMPIDTGLSTELPVTLEKTSTPGPDTCTLILRTDDVRTFSGYPGHLITVTLYEPDP